MQIFKRLNKFFRCFSFYWFFLSTKLSLFRGCNHKINFIFFLKKNKVNFYFVNSKVLGNFCSVVDCTVTKKVESFFFKRVKRTFQWSFFLNNIYKKQLTFVPIFKAFSLLKKKLLNLLVFYKKRRQRFVNFYFRRTENAVYARFCHLVELEQLLYLNSDSLKIKFVKYLQYLIKHLFFAKKIYYLQPKFKTFKFFFRFLKKSHSNFIKLPKWRWLEDKIQTLHQLRLTRTRYLNAVEYFSLKYYRLFKARQRLNFITTFFSSWNFRFMSLLGKKFRRRKVFHRLVFCRIKEFNKVYFAFIQIIKEKRKLAAFYGSFKRQNLESFFYRVGKQKLVRRLYKHLTKVLFSINLTRAWMSFYNIPVIFFVQNRFTFPQFIINKVLAGTRKSFYLRHYAKNAQFINSMLAGLLSLYYRSPYLLNEMISIMLRRSSRHRRFIFNVFKLISVLLWRTTFVKTSGSRLVHTVFLAVNGKVNSASRTKHFKLKIDYKPAFSALENSLSFSKNFSNAGTGTFGIQTWFSY